MFPRSLQTINGLQKFENQGRAVLRDFFCSCISAYGIQFRGKGESDRRWAAVRLVLGMLQMIGAAFSMGLLVRGGVNAFSLAAATFTTLFTTLSVLLFRNRRRNAVTSHIGGRKRP